ncbi:M48 family metallopeptidase [Maricaulis sp. CAU 1757]
MSRQSIRLADRDVAYTLKRSARRRTIGFTISHDGLTVAVPQRAGMVRVEAALREKAGWILPRLDKWAERPQPRQLVFEDGEELPWLGGALRLRLEPGGVRTTVRRDGNGLLIRHDGEMVGELRQRTLTAAVQRFYRREGEAHMTPRTLDYAAQLGRTVRKVVVRDQKRRWGSCAPDGTIRLNWRLMGFPPELIDYVCAHEAAHLVEANHSPAYWRVVASIMPDWKQRRARMRDEAGTWALP